jgi:hypothetical protein
LPTFDKSLQHIHRRGEGKEGWDSFLSVIENYIIKI